MKDVQDFETPPVDLRPWTSQRCQQVTKALHEQGVSCRWQQGRDNHERLYCILRGAGDMRALAAHFEALMPRAILWQHKSGVADFAAALWVNPTDSDWMQHHYSQASMRLSGELDIARRQTRQPASGVRQDREKE